MQYLAILVGVLKSKAIPIQNIYKSTQNNHTYSPNNPKYFNLWFNKNSIPDIWQQLKSKIVNLIMIFYVFYKRIVGGKTRQLLV